MKITNGFERKEAINDLEKALENCDMMQIEKGYRYDVADYLLDAIIANKISNVRFCYD